MKNTRRTICKIMTRELNEYLKTLNSNENYKFNQSSIDYKLYRNKHDERYIVSNHKTIKIGSPTTEEEIENTIKEIVRNSYYIEDLIN